MSETGPAAPRPSTTPHDSTAPTTVAATAEKARPLGLSATQIAGGALAAVTAAVAASFFGVAGTLAGAALGSVVSSIAAALYSTSLTRAARVSKVLVVRPAGSGTGPLEASAQDPAAVPPVVPPQPLVEAYPWWRRIAWKPVTLVAGLLFVATLAVVQVSELALGRPLGNAEGSGTTLTNIGGGGGAPAPQAPSEPSSPTSPTQSPSPTGTPTPSDSAPAATPTPGPSTPGPTAPDSPAATPSPTTTSPSEPPAGSPSPTGPAPSPDR